MLGVIVIFIISWVVVYFSEKDNLLTKWFLPVNYRVKQFLLGFFFTVILAICLQSIKTVFEAHEWNLNSDISFSLIFNAFLFDLRSVLTEELVFRGVLLYFLIKKLNVQKAIYISAAAFGVYHLFSFGVIGNLIPMVIIFFGTGFMGFAWAKAYAKTHSILLPFGMHLGWNFVVNTIFSKGPLGNLVLILNKIEPESSEVSVLTEMLSLVSFILPYLLAPILTLLYLKYFIREYSK